MIHDSNLVAAHLPSVEARLGKGYLTADQVSALATGVTTIFGALLVILPLIRKIYNSSTTATIQQINTGDNGVKVVAATAPGAPVNAPQK